MRTHVLMREQWLAASLDEVFAFFSDAANLEAITPPWLGFHIVTPRPIDMRRGAKIEYRIDWHFLPLRWHTEIVDWTPPHGFVDVQTRGPYKLWHHTHRFEARDGGTQMCDTVEYALPLGPLGELAHRLAVRKDLGRVFDYRAEQIALLFSDPAEVSSC